MAIFTFKEALSRVAEQNPTETPIETPSVATKEPSLLDRLSARFKKAVSNTVPVITGEATPKELALNAFSTGANVVGGVADVAQTAFKTIGDAVAPTSVKQGAEAAIKDITSSLDIKDIVNKYANFKKDNPVAGELFDNAFDIVNFILTFVGTPKVGAGVTKTAAEIPSLVKTGAEAIANTEPVQMVGQAVRNTANSALTTAESTLATAKDVGSGIKTIANLSMENAGDLPRRISSNVEKLKSVSNDIKTLPTKIAQQSVRDGVDKFDVIKLYSIPEEQKSLIKPIVDAAKKFDLTGGVTTNPIELVGRPIVANLKEANNKLTKVGKLLGEVSKSLPVIPQSDLITPVLSKLQSVPGLEGITLNKKGILNFKNTALQTAENASVRKNLQDVFTKATSYTSGQKKNLLRQELFNILDGKKKALVNLTDTEEKAYEAIRTALGDVLSSKNADYGALSTEYAKIARPLSELKKMIKYDPFKDGDLLNLSAGVLARRLTSYAPSQVEIKNVLRSLDEAVANTGLAQNAELAQEVYNILDNYYNISKKTGIQGQFTAGIEKANNFRDVVSQSVGQIVGKTDAVKRKAIENILSEIFPDLFK